MHFHRLPPSEQAVLCLSLERGLNTPLTSSIGRLFDAVACLCVLGDTATYEAQSALFLEDTARRAVNAGCPYEIPLVDDGTGAAQLDWQPMIEALLFDVSHHVPVAQIALGFHDALAAAATALCERFAKRTPIVLTGGVFQNRVLLESTVKQLRAKGFAPYWHETLPANDGCLAVGQIAYVLERFNERRAHVPCSPGSHPQH